MGTKNSEKSRFGAYPGSRAAFGMLSRGFLGVLTAFLEKCKNIRKALPFLRKMCYNIENTGSDTRPIPFTEDFSMAIKMRVLYSSNKKGMAQFANVIKNKYELPINLASVDTKLYMASWRPSHSSSGWRVVNDFYATEDEN